MIASTATGRTPVNLRDPGQLLAALPFLVGFRPQDSVVLLGHTEPAGRGVGMALRGELPPRTERRRQAEALAARVTTPPHTGVTVMVVGGGGAGAGNRLPHKGFIEHLRHALDARDLPVQHALWVPEVARGAPWRCYDDDACSGRLPDPRSTVLAAIAVEDGQITYDSRAELAELLMPRDPEAVAGRALQLARMSEPPWGDADAIGPAAAEIRAALQRQRRGAGPPTDDQAVRLAWALSCTRVRDACLGTAVPAKTALATEAELLWLTLVRELPAPHRANAGALLGYAAYMRGHGTFAGMALDNAAEADSDCMLVQLMLIALENGFPPDRLAGLADYADADVLELIAG